MDKNTTLYLVQLIPVLLLVLGGVRVLTRQQTETKNQGVLLEKIGDSLEDLNKEKVSEKMCKERHKGMEKLHRLALQSGADRMTQIEGSIDTHGKIMMKSMDTLAGQVKDDIASLEKTFNEHLEKNGGKL